ncbi:hypothetical protein PM082_022661 [Marasmius tenuissimus]|nr:hypothetical protein PM082_022661 [Marasmius tenuissimus]
MWSPYILYPRIGPPAGVSASRIRYEPVRAYVLLAAGARESGPRWGSSVRGEKRRWIGEGNEYYSPLSTMPGIQCYLKAR